MRLAKQILGGLAVAGIAALGTTAMAVYYGEKALKNSRSADGECRPLNAFEKYGVAVGRKFDLLDPPPCGMCGMG